MLTVRLRTGSKEKQSVGQTIRQTYTASLTIKIILKGRQNAVGFPDIKITLKGRQTAAGFPYCKNHFEKEDLSCRQMKIQLH